MGWVWVLLVVEEVRVLVHCLMVIQLTLQLLTILVSGWVEGERVILEVVEVSQRQILPQLRGPRRRWNVHVRVITNVTPRTVDAVLQGHPLWTKRINFL